MRKKLSDRFPVNCLVKYKGKSKITKDDFGNRKGIFGNSIYRVCDIEKKSLVLRVGLRFLTISPKDFVRVEEITTYKEVK